MTGGPADTFLDRYDEWVARDDPPDHWRIAVLLWVHSVVEEPYGDSIEHPMGIPGLRWAEIPLGGIYPQAVVCEYRVEYDTGEITCHTIATLDRPL